MDEQHRRERRAEYLVNFINLLKQESDRGCVIVSAALIDDILDKLLKKRLAPPADNKRDELFDSNSALSTFSARIDLAYRLGLLRSSSRRTFHMLRKIRNNFAHISTPESFGSDSVKSRVLEMFSLNREIIDSFSTTMIENGLKNFEDARFFEVVGIRTAYELLISSIAAFLLEEIENVEQIKHLEQLTRED